jgi:hypothetical protein
MYHAQFATGWASSDADRDIYTSSCATLYAGVTQHYSNCWSYSLGADAENAPYEDGGWGPHVYAPSTLANLGLISDGTNYSRVRRILRWMRDGSGETLLGQHEAHAAASCEAIVDAGQSVGDGPYWVDVDGADGAEPARRVYCDMTIDGGGWVLIYRSVGSFTGATTAFWNIPYAERLSYRGAIDGGDNFYWGLLHGAGASSATRSRTSTARPRRPSARAPRGLT